MNRHRYERFFVLFFLTVTKIQAHYRTKQQKSCDCHKIQNSHSWSSFQPLELNFITKQYYTELLTGQKYICFVAIMAYCIFYPEKMATRDFHSMWYSIKVVNSEAERVKPEMAHPCRKICSQRSWMKPDGLGLQCVWLGLHCSHVDDSHQGNVFIIDAYLSLENVFHCSY